MEYHGCCVVSICKVTRYDVITHDIIHVLIIVKGGIAVHKALDSHE